MFHCRHPLKCFPFFLHTLEFMPSLLVKPRSDSLSVAMFALQSKMDIPLYLTLRTGGAERKDCCQGAGTATACSQPRTHTQTHTEDSLQPSPKGEKRIFQQQDTGRNSSGIAAQGGKKAWSCGPVKRSTENTNKKRKTGKGEEGSLWRVCGV